MLAGCIGERPAPPAILLDAYRTRMGIEPVRAEVSGGPRGRAGSGSTEQEATQAGQEPRRSLLTGPQATTQPALEDVLEQIPDPSEAAAVFQARLERVKEQSRNDPRVVKNFEKTVAYAMELLELLKRERRVELSLSECIRRALASSYAIRAAAHGPAISQTQIVEAEAAFDAVFFLDTSWNNRDAPTASQLASNQSDSRSISGGLRKLLPTGGDVSTSLQTLRTHTDLQFATINPAYSTDFVTTFRQPILRGFGLDVNRSQILIARAGYGISREQYLRQVQDTLFAVEQAYWTLVRARRDAAVLAISVGQNRTTYESMWERREHDATPVEINNALSRWKSRSVLFTEAVRAVKDAEDVLKNLLNERDPDLLLSRDVEIVPTELPIITPVAVDQLAEVRTAIDARTEVREARLNIERARVATAVAKNQTLPQLDLTFSYDVGGIGPSADQSLDKMTTNRFRSYTVGATFSYPIGNRGPRVAHRRAQLQESQAIVALNQVTDTVVQEVNAAVRAIGTRFDQIPPQYEACAASANNLSALQARAQRITPEFLETELNTVERLSNDRSQLIQVITEYNVALIALERAKGTLLEHNRVVVDESGP